MQQQYYSNGKLLLTAEYGVLDGATALAIPTKFGQELSVALNETSQNLAWKSLDSDGSLWFTATVEQATLALLDTSDNKIGKRLSEILLAARTLNPEFLRENQGLYIETRLTFNRHWGLGTSSTLINNIALWANINPYELLENTFGGSGYDIACAQNNSSILYTRREKSPKVQEVDFLPPFVSDIYFVYLNKKQDSRLAIKNYKEQLGNSEKLVEKLSELTYAILKAEQLTEFQSLITEHEQCLSKVLKYDPVKERLFSDYKGAIKSLGGWGGDFILAAGNKKTPAYFQDKGFSVVVPYEDMVR